MGAAPERSLRSDPALRQDGATGGSLRGARVNAAAASPSGHHPKLRESIDIR